MKKLLFALLLSLSPLSQAQLVKDMSVKLDFRSMNVAAAVQLIYSEVVKEPYVIDPEVLGDTRQVSFRYDPAKGELRPFVANFFDSLGLAITRKGGVDYIARKVSKDREPEKDVYVYTPRYRDGSYLADMLSPLFEGSFTSRKAVRGSLGGDKAVPKAPAGSAADSIDRGSDTLVFSGTAAEIGKLKKVLAQVDIATGAVMVRGVLYEVQTTNTDGSAFSVALNLLGGHLGVSLGGAPQLGDNFLRLKTNAIDVVATSLAGDSRFKVVSTPSLRVKSGQTGRITVGQDVPVLGSVTYPTAGGAPVQSVEYRSSGVIFDLEPVVRADSVDLTFMQQVSNFAVTNTGVNGSPTLNKREIRSSLSVNDGEVIVIGGLQENKDTTANSGLSFVPEFLRTKRSDKANTEILLVLQVTKI